MGVIKTNFKLLLNSVLLIGISLVTGCGDTPVSNSITTIMSTGIDSIFIYRDNKLYGYGYGSNGVFGNGSYESFGNFTQIQKDHQWEIITTTWTHTLGIKKDGTLWTWGKCSNGEMGKAKERSVFTIPVKIGNDIDWKFVNTGNHSSVAIKKDGTLWVWGGGLKENVLVLEPNKLSDETDWVFVAVNSGVFAAVKRNNSLWGWGVNGKDSLGLDKSVSSNVPQLIDSDSKWIYVSVGYRCLFAVKEDGSLWCLGDNYHGQLGIGNSINYSRELKRIPLPFGVKTIVAADVHTHAILEDGSLWSWGENGLGQLAIGDFRNTCLPTQIGKDKDWMLVDADDWYLVACKKDGSIYFSGRKISGVEFDKKQIVNTVEINGAACTNSLILLHKFAYSQSNK